MVGLTCKDSKVLTSDSWKLHRRNHGSNSGGDESARPEGPKLEGLRVGMGFSPPHQLGGLGSAVSSPSGVNFDFGVFWD